LAVKDATMRLSAVNAAEAMLSMALRPGTGPSVSISVLTDLHARPPSPSQPALDGRSSLTMQTCASKNHVTFRTQRNTM
jgi:hypothetical protein